MGPVAAKSRDLVAETVGLGPQRKNALDAGKVQAGSPVGRHVDLGDVGGGGVMRTGPATIGGRRAYHTRTGTDGRTGEDGSGGGAGADVSAW